MERGSDEQLKYMREYRKSAECVKKQNENLKCECSGKYQYKHKGQHEKSKKHINYIKKSLKE